jgi:hypothetical protein
LKTLIDDSLLFSDSKSQKLIDLTLFLERIGAALVCFIVELQSTQILR